MSAFCRQLFPVYILQIKLFNTKKNIAVDLHKKTQNWRDDMTTVFIYVAPYYMIIMLKVPSRHVLRHNYIQSQQTPFRILKITYQWLKGLDSAI